PRLPWKDLHRWTGKDFEFAIDSFYSKSIDQPDALQIPAENARFILEGDTSDMTIELRPRIYDLLRERHIYFLQNPRFHRSSSDYLADRAEVKELTAMDLSDFLKRKELSHHPFYKIVAAWHDW